VGLGGFCHRLGFGSLASSFFLVFNDLFRGSSVFLEPASAALELRVGTGFFVGRGG
jgi:hypothetical protein